MSWKKLVFESFLAAIIAFLLLSTSLVFARDDGMRAPKAPGGDFTLQSLEGPVSLHQFRGKVVLLFFGFISCPDVCPISLSRMESAFSKMKSEELKRVQALFISLDPERDTLEKLKQYTEYFHPNILGVTEKQEVLALITKQYGVSYTKKVLVNSAIDYVINHTPDIFLIDSQGKLRKVLTHDTSPEFLRNSVRRFLKKS